MTTTARSLSIGIQMLGEREVGKTGVLAPEGCVPTAAFFDKMADGGGMTLNQEVRTRSVLISQPG